MRESQQRRLERLRRNVESDAVRLPGHGVTIASWFSGADGEQAEALLAAQEDGRLELYREMTESIAKVRGRAA